MSETGWSQEVFDRTLQDYLVRHEVEVWPRAINKKGFFLTLKALEESPIKDVKVIETELQQTVLAERADGRSAQAPLGYIIAAKRASKDWSYYKGTASPTIAIRTRFGALGIEAWRQAIAKKFKSMLGGRRSGAGFMRVGWLSVLQILGPIVGGRYNRSAAGSGVHGRPKGAAAPASEGNLVVTIENFANARSEVRGAFMRLGEPALQRAFDRETADMVGYLEGEMRPEAEKFNARQH